jgi:hypothetical protein
MKKTPLRRKSPLRPGSEPARPRKPLPKANRARRKVRFAEQFDSPAFLEFVKALPCVVCGEGPCDAAHVRSRGAGGKACDVTSLCFDCHRLQHELGVVTFGNLYGIKLKDAATATWASWQALQEEAA